MKLNLDKSILFVPAIIVTLLTSSMVFAQTKEINFRHLTSSDGLSQNRVLDIAQDQDGFIWIGTEDGLNRYDGYNFEVFKTIPGDSNSLADNFSTVLLITKDGTLWSGGNFSGLSRFNAESNNFTSYQRDHSDPYSLGDNFIISLSESEKGNLWLGTNNNGFDYMIVKEEKFIHMQNMLPKDYPLQRDELTFVYQDGLNNLWVGALGKVHYFNISYTDNGIPQLRPILIRNQSFRNAVITIEESIDNQIWIGTEGEGLWKFDRENLTLDKVQFGNANTDAAVNATSILALESDDKGNIWIGGLEYSGTNEVDLNKTLFFKLNTQNSYFQQYNLNAQNEPGLRTRGVLSLYLDKTGVLWIGTGLGGVRVLDESLVKFISYLANPNDNSKFSNAIRGFYLDQEDLLWIATQGDGLISYDRKSEKINFYKNNRNDPNTISSNFATSIYNDGEYLWIGTFNGLNRFDKKTKKFKSFFVGENDEGFRVNYNILEIDKFPGYLWFGTNGNGLVKFNKNDFTFKQYKYDPEVDNGLDNRRNFVRFVWYSDKRPNEIWMGTTNGINILILDDETFRNYKHDPNDSTSISHSNVMDCYEDDEGFVWVSTYGGGLNRYDPSTKKFLRFTEGNSNLPNNGIYGALKDRNGFLWVSTNNGITKFNPKTFEFRNYTVDDGLQSEEFNGGAYHLAYNGEMFFGGIKGFNSFIPEEISDNKFIPNIVITDFKIFNESIRVGEDFPLKQEITKTSQIILDYWQNDISFEYVSLHFSNPSKNKYAFKLDNYDDQWRYVNDIRVATYTNLDPGEYVFRVKGSNNDGLWNEKGIALSLIIRSPWWQTWWAYSLYFLGFVSILGGIRKFELDRRNEKENKRLLQLENERKTKELEQAKEIEKAYTELKATQAQLIHSEKMASLGELTAGIAHEIKNPLNFINNFSDISTELLDEMQTELNSNGNRSYGVKEIVNNLKQNLEKINQHGKRADSIVKRMLLHSRGTSGEKTLTDINDLLDQYVNLAYHGMRAQNKEFNITIEKDYDKTLKKINVVPQDISRVFLNIINNACYQAYDKKKKSNDNNFSPTLSVSTKDLNGNVEIRIRDNGNGIPSEILDKIFQPFFTTKPTGEGTGLGLSLSYDIIVKQHSGEIKFESEEGKYAEFIIILPKF